MDMNEFNRQVIDEFRSNGGRVGGNFEGAPLLILHHTGARTGTERVTPLMFRSDGEAWVVFASKAGAPTSPDWYHNLRANPDTTIEVGDGTEVSQVSVSAMEATGDDRDELWEAQKRDFPQFAEYEQSTERTIPVLRLVAR